MSDYNYYMVRSIENSSNHLNNFTNNNIVAVGWSNINFSQFDKPNQVISQLGYLNEISPQTAGRHKGQIRRFFEIKKNDRIIVPYWDSVCLAIATGQKKYNQKNGSIDQANEADVNYLRDADHKLIIIPRDSLSEGLQRRIRVRGMTISDLNEFQEEIELFFNKAQSEKIAFSWKIKIEEKQKTEIDNFKLRLLANIRNGNTNLKTGSIGLEKLIKELLTIEGYTAYIPSKRAFPSYADADVIAVKADKFQESKILFQIKHHQGLSDSWGIKQLLEIKKQLPEEYKDHKLVFITTADVSAEVDKFADDNDVYVIDGNELVNWIAELIKSIRSETKGKLGIIETPQVI